MNKKPADIGVADIIDDLQAHFESGGVEVERQGQYVLISVNLHDGQNPVITPEQPIHLTVFSNRVEAEYVETEPVSDEESTFDHEAQFTGKLVVEHTEAVRLRLTYDLNTRA